MCWTVRGSNPNGTKGLSLLQNILTSSGANLALYSVDTRVSSWGQSNPDMKVTTFLHLVLQLGMSGPIPLLPLTPSWHGQGNFYLFIFNIYYLNDKIKVDDTDGGCSLYEVRYEYMFIGRSQWNNPLMKCG
jgi:hypothetical protein